MTIMNRMGNQYEWTKHNRWMALLLPRLETTKGIRYGVAQPSGKGNVDCNGSLGDGRRSQERGLGEREGRNGGHCHPSLRFGGFNGHGPSRRDGQEDAEERIETDKTRERILMNETETCKRCYALILYEFRAEHEAWHHREEIEPKEIQRLVKDGLESSSLLKCGNGGTNEHGVFQQTEGGITCNP